MSRREDEDSVYRAALVGLQRWLGKARDAVMRPWLQYKAMPDPVAIFETQGVWDREVDTILTVLGKISLHAWSLATDVPPVSRHAFVMSQLAQTQNFLVRVPDEIYNLIFAELTDGTNAGESLEQLAQRVDNLLSFGNNWNGRARNIAVTECLPPEAVVNSANILAAYRRWYEGDFITVLTKQGYKFTGTPNHPVLTQRGWVGLGSLSKQDRLVCNKRAVEVMAVPGDPGVQAPPTQIAQLFDAVHTVGVRGRVLAGEPDFHGDGSHGEVDVSLTRCELRFNNFKPLSEDSLKVCLDSSDSAAVLLARESAPLPVGWRTQGGGLSFVSSGDSSQPQDASDGIASGLELISYLLATPPRQVEVRDFLRIQFVAGGTWTLVTPKDGGGHGGFSVAGHPGSPEYSVDCVNPIPSLSSERVSADPRDVFLDDVVDVLVRHRATHVYNLSTVEGYFLSGGVYTGNTTRAYGAGTLAAGMEQSRVTGRRLMKMWDDEEDSRVRPSHHAVNGEKIPLSAMFMVGGFPLLYPGDPMGPADEVCGCRCRLLITNEEER